jgi:hypothetical protein
MNEIQFVVEKATDDGLIARAIVVSIFTEAADLKNLRLQIADAVRCHFDEDKAPQRIILC